MGLVFWTRRWVALAGLAAGLAVSAGAQTSIALTEPAAPLLPAKFGGWVRAATVGDGVGSSLGSSLMSLGKDALVECGEQRSTVADYTHAGRVVHVEAIEFGDKTGASSAFTLAKQAVGAGGGVGVDRALGMEDSVSGGAVLFVVGKTVVLADFAGAASAVDVTALKPLEEAMPKVFGNVGMAPMLPTLAPANGLVAGSLRYALGPVSYAAEGGVLPAGSLDWKMEPEAVTARYDDARGRETLTVLLYPTPTIAAKAAKAIEDGVPELKGGSGRLRQSGTLVSVATGSFTGDAAEAMVKGIHLSVMTFNQDVHPPFKVVAAQTFTLLESIAVLSGILGAAAVLLGVFLGFGRAWFRVLRGKPAAVEVEFLSLHLAPQNKPAQFSRPDSA
jgi:hypothetical protein